MAQSLYIIDGHAQIYRAFYAPFRELTSPAGEPTRATFVFCQMLFNILRNKRPDYLCMVMDVSDETVFRRDIYPEYKANREPPPEALPVQADRIVSIVRALDIPLYTLPGFEADDLIATICEQTRGRDLDVYIVSKDKDLEQLLSDRVRLYDANADTTIDAAGLLASKGYPPQLAVEVQCLAGDTVDNIPGVDGVGVKTAAKLVQRYGSARAVVEHADELTPKQSERVRAFGPNLEKTRRLVELRRDVQFPFELEACRASRIQVAAVRPIFAELAFGRLTEALDALDPNASLYPAGEPALPSPTSADAGTTAATIATVSAPGAPPGNYVLVDTPESFARFVGELAAQREFAFDTETTSTQPVDAALVGLSFAWHSGKAWFLPVRAGGGGVLPEAEVVAVLKPVFENPQIRKSGQNIKFDALVLRALGIHVAGIAFDTMIAAFLLDPSRRSFSLDGLVRAHFQHEMIPITDLIGKGRDQLTMDMIDTQRLCTYAAEDADFTWRLKEVFEPQIAGSHVEKLFHEVEMPLVDVLTAMEFNGIALDTKLLAELSRDMGDRLFALQRDIHRAAGREFNVDSTKQLAEVLFDDQGLKVQRRTKTGRSTDADTLTALAAASDNPIPRLVLEYRELAKLRSTYVETLPKMVSKRTGRIHTSFHQTGAITGRLSSSDPNLQNIPIRTETGRQIRRAFIAGSPEQLILTIDYSQIELRLLAHFCEDRNLITAFEQGQDIHRAVAAQVNGVTPEAVTSEQRARAKAVNFGIVYGQTAFGLARGLGISQTEARDFINRYFQRYPGIRSFIDHCVDEARSKGYAETLFGRRRPIPELHSRNRGQVSLGERLAVNTVVQGSAADLIKKAMIDVDRALRGGESRAKMLLQVHDELVFETPRASVEQDAALIRGLMESAVPLRVPLLADAAWGDNWAEGK
ncbi:MAG: DNA polymerase I [Phycisphaerae bacterium]|nr:DNA polymerase I [Phycisphaerae bacterium]